MQREGQRNSILQFDLFTMGFKRDSGSRCGPERMVLGQAEPPWIPLAGGRLCPAHPTCLDLPSVWQLWGLVSLMFVARPGPEKDPSSWLCSTLSQCPLPVLPSWTLFSSFFNQQNSASSLRSIARITSLKNSLAFHFPHYLQQNDMVFCCHRSSFFQFCRISHCRVVCLWRQVRF